MRLNKINCCSAFLLLNFVFFIGCEYDIIPPPPPPEVANFQEDVMPIFNASCNYAGCHNGPNGFVPDLTMEGAYEALWSGNFIDTISPKNSLLYRSLIGDDAKLMPPPDGWDEDDIETITILLWIEEGALDN